MQYVIIEMQTNNGSTAILTDQKGTRNEADSVYYLKLAAAAISKVPIHTVALLDENGACLMSGCYDHQE